MVPGHEQANARMTPDGGLEIRVGVHSHGQGLETTLAQVAHEILGLDTKKVRVVHGDTPSRPIRREPGAHARWSWPVVRLEPPVLKSASAPSESAPSFFNLIGNGYTARWPCMRTNSSIGLAEIAHAWYRRPQDLPPMSIREDWNQQRLQAAA